MEFKGWKKTSLIEYPGKIVSVVWTGGCDFRCPFCYNRDLVLNPKRLPSTPESKIINHLVNNRKFLDGVAITGGEPTLHNDLPNFIKKVKELGFVVELETNGTNPKMLKQLINDKLVDYIAMDIKAPLVWNKYKKAAGITDKKLFDKVKVSIKIILSSNANYEFRTTVIPTLHHKKDIIEIAKYIKGAKKYVLQQFVPRTTVNKEYEQAKPYSKEELNEIKKQIKGYFKICEVRA